MLHRLIHIEFLINAVILLYHLPCRFQEYFRLPEPEGSNHRRILHRRIRNRLLDRCACNISVCIGYHPSIGVGIRQNRFIVPVSKDNTVALLRQRIKGIPVNIHAVVASRNQQRLFRIQIRLRQHTGACLSLRQMIHRNEGCLRIICMNKILHTVRLMKASVHIDHVAAVCRHARQIPGSTDYHRLLLPRLPVYRHDGRFVHRITCLRKTLACSRHRNQNQPSLCCVN